MKTLICRADVLAAAKELGFTGDDPALALAHCATEGVTFEVEGKTFAAADCDLEAEGEKKPRSFSAKAAAKPNADEPIQDILAKAKATVYDQLVKDGILKRAGAGFKPVTPGSEIKVRSLEERIYEDRIARKSAFFTNVDTAVLCKHWLNSMIAQAATQPETYNKEFTRFKELHERITGKAYTTTDAQSAAPLMPDAFIPDLIRNVTEAGVARRLCKVVPMTTGQAIFPRRTGGLSASFPAENSNATASTATYDNVTLNAKTAVIIAQASEQTLQDCGLGFVDITMQEMATTQAQLEDDCLLVGDGTATYGGMTGFESTSKYGATATDGGNIVVGGASADVHTATQIINAIARVPLYARKGMVITIQGNLKPVIFDRLAVSTPGGLTLQEIAGFGLVSAWMGVPIIENNSMSSVTDAGSTARGKGFTAGDQIDFLIGDFSRAALFGDRMAWEVSMSREVGFQSYSVYLRSVARFCTNVHGTGSSTAAGPVVAFYQT